MSVEIPLSALIHAEPGAGKSTLAATAPAPRLVLDAEGGSRHTKKFVNGKARRIKSVSWDPVRDAPPEVGEWEQCVVAARDYNTVLRTYEWLNAGKHPFRSVVMDSFTEIQKKCKDAIKQPTEDMTERLWGQMLERMERLIRDFRDLTNHPTNPIDVLVVITLTKAMGTKYKPAVQGALGVSLPGYVDVVGFLASYVNEDGEEERGLLINPRELYEAKDRTHTLTERFGHTIINPNVEQMLAIMNEEDND